MCGPYRARLYDTGCWHIYGNGKGDAKTPNLLLPATICITALSPKAVVGVKITLIISEVIKLEAVNSHIAQYAGELEQSR